MEKKKDRSGTPRMHRVLLSLYIFLLLLLVVVVVLCLLAFFCTGAGVPEREGKKKKRDVWNASDAPVQQGKRYFHLQDADEANAWRNRSQDLSEAGTARIPGFGLAVVRALKNAASRT